jgi:hypothetical protein
MVFWQWYKFYVVLIELLRRIPLKKKVANVTKEINENVELSEEKQHYPEIVKSPLVRLSCFFHFFVTFNHRFLFVLSFQSL